MKLLRVILSVAIAAAYSAPATAQQYPSPTLNNVTIQGNLTLPSKSSNNFFAAPSGGAGVPSFRLMSDADLLGLSPNFGNPTASSVPPLTDNSTSLVSSAWVKGIADFTNLIAEGADNTGTVDASTILASALTNKTDIFLPSGTYRLNTLVSYSGNKSFRIRGAGKGKTSIVCYDASGCLSFAFSDILSRLDISDVTFTAANVGSNGTAINVSYPAVLSNVFPSVNFQRLQFVGGVFTTSAFATGVNLTNAWNARITDIFITGRTGTSPPVNGIGIQLNCGSLSAMIRNFYLSSLVYGIFVEDSTCDSSGQRVEGLIVNSGEMTNVVTGIKAAHPSQTPGSNISELHIASFGPAISLTNQVQMSINDTLLYNIAGGVAQWVGIQLLGASVDNSIHDNRLFGANNASTTAQAGVQLLDNSASNSVHDNSCNFFGIVGQSCIVLANNASQNSVQNNISKQNGQPITPLANVSAGPRNYFLNNVADNGFLPTASGACALSSIIGSATSGSFVTGVACAGTAATLTFKTVSQTGWACSIQNLNRPSGPGQFIRQSGYTVNSATFVLETVAADQLTYSCSPF